MPSSKKFYLFRMMVKNTKWWSNRIYPFLSLRLQHFSLLKRVLKITNIIFSSSIDSIGTLASITKWVSWLQFCSNWFSLRQFSFSKKPKNGLKLALFFENGYFLSNLSDFVALIFKMSPKVEATVEKNWKLPEDISLEMLNNAIFKIT